MSKNIGINMCLCVACTRGPKPDMIRQTIVVNGSLGLEFDKPHFDLAGLVQQCCGDLSPD